MMVTEDALHPEWEDGNSYIKITLVLAVTFRGSICGSEPPEMSTTGVVLVLFRV